MVGTPDVRQRHLLVIFLEDFKQLDSVCSCAVAIIDACDHDDRHLGHIFELKFKLVFLALVLLRPTCCSIGRVDLACHIEIDIVLLEVTFQNR